MVFGTMSFAGSATQKWTKLAVRGLVRYEVPPFAVPIPMLVLGVGLATRHVSSGASGVPRRVKVERRRQKQ